MYKVVLEVRTHADSPHDAALQINDLIKSDNCLFMYYIQDSDMKIYTVDLAEDHDNAVKLLEDYRPLIK